jgi:hypothetical protein
VTLFSIFEHDDAARAETPLAVSDGFSWLGFLLPAVYLVAHRLWIFAILFVLALLAIVAGGMWLGGEASFWLYVLLALLVGFEGATLRRRKLGRLGYHYRSDRLARNADAALVDWLARGRA